MRRINEYFFGGTPSFEDVTWFYGGILAMLVIGVIGLWQ